jgi:putative two-component system response regulator
VLESGGEVSKTVLCVDDDTFNLMIYKSVLEEHGYLPILATCGLEALNTLITTPCDLVLLDYMMPGMNGLDVCKAIRAKKDFFNLPIVFATADSERKVKIQAYEAGASDFISKPVDPIELVARIRNLLSVKEYQDSIKEYNLRLKGEVKQKSKELSDSYIETIRRLALATEHRDEDTAQHINRISNYALLLSSALGLPEEEAEIIYYAAPMHDVGKIGIPDSILNKPGKLDSHEFEVMKTHSRIGASILAHSSSPILKCAEIIARDHHERYDGSGYPDGKKGEEISFAGRLLCMVDVYDALRMRRPYKQCIPHGKTIHIMANGDDRTTPSHFDPRIFQAFMDIHPMFDDIYNMKADCEGTA